MKEFIQSMRFFWNYEDDLTEARRVLISLYLGASLAFISYIIYELVDFLGH